MHSVGAVIKTYKLQAIEAEGANHHLWQSHRTILIASETTFLLLFPIKFIVQEIN
jgi:hypothetical protein